MTNKQAQITINSIKFMLDHAQYSDDVEEALNMAISALTAQSTMGQVFDRDTISRQAAIDEIRKWKRYETTEGLAERIENLPSAQPDNRLSKIAELVEGTIDHFDLDDAMDLLYQIKDVLR